MALSALVFPGQGSQSVGMLADVAREFSEIEATFAEASSVLQFDLWKLTQEGPGEELDKTVNTQPALLAASYAIWRILQNNKVDLPTLLAGHSLGEYTALVCAQSLDFADAIKLVAARGQYMQDAVPSGEGALAAIVGLDDEAVNAVCVKAAEGDVLAPANYNSPGQIVIAGKTAAVQRAIILAKEAGAKLAKQLAVSVPSHCILMQPAGERLAELLKTIKIQTPRIPVINNVDAVLYDDAESICNGLTRQLYMPVRWVDIIHHFKNTHVTRIIECGPGKVLSGLNKRIATDIEMANTADLASLQKIIFSEPV